MCLFLRAAVWYPGKGVACLHAGGRPPQRAAYGAARTAGGRRQREGAKLAERCLPQADDWRFQGDQGCRRRLPQSSETLGAQTERGEAQLRLSLLIGLSSSGLLRARIKQWCFTHLLLLLLHKIHDNLELHSYKKHV